MNVWVTVSSALFGTLVGASLTWLISRHQQKLYFTLDLHREFNSADMVEVRYSAGRLLEKHPEKSLRELTDKYIGTPELHDIWKIILFYQRLWIVVQHRRVIRKEIPPLFGEIFDWWYVQAFERQLLPLDNKLSRDISDFHSWLTKTAKRSEVEEWRRSHIFWPAPGIEHPGNSRARSMPEDTASTSQRAEPKPHPD
ncbi:hypothetical protein [Cryptosporangium aurantiacum]|uniref:hypothetical protein n=1 Tax=Cryptosporangium aurantiacum TaxID=134849 RepID=UPI001160F165|nr:hypothetical protein [Cryptosporangium aurantiacum]